MCSLPFASSPLQLIDDEISTLGEIVLAEGKGYIFQRRRKYRELIHGLSRERETFNFLEISEALVAGHKPLEAALVKWISLSRPHGGREEQCHDMIGRKYNIEQGQLHADERETTAIRFALRAVERTRTLSKQACPHQIVSD